MHESLEHAALVELFRRHPDLAVMLAAQRGVVVPAGCEARAVDPVLQVGSLVPDVVVALEDADGVVQLSLIVEVQRDVRPAKLRTWAAYLWVEALRRGCDCELVVVTGSREDAAWAAQTVRCGSNEVTWTVIGPDEVPKIEDPAEARRYPELAVLSAAAWGRGPDGLAIGRAAVAGLQGLPPDESRLYLRMIYRALGRDLFQQLQEDIMQEHAGADDEEVYGFEDFAPYVHAPNHSVLRMLTEELRRRDIQAQVAEDLRYAVLRVYEARFGEATPEQRERVRSCRHRWVFDEWLTRAATVTDPTEVFVEVDVEME